jgi:hypothetical protein
MKGVTSDVDKVMDEQRERFMNQMKKFAVYV